MCMCDTACDTVLSSHTHGRFLAPFTSASPTASPHCPCCSSTYGHQPSAQPASPPSLAAPTASSASPR